MIRVMLADKDRLVIQLLGRLIDGEDDMCVSRMCTDGKSLLSALRSGRHDVVVLDPIGLSPLDVELLNSMRAVDAGARVVVVTASQKDADLFSAVRAGVRGYISKSTDVHDVLSAIRAAYSGAALLSQETAAQLMDAFARQSYEETGLSPRQRDILEGLVRGRTNREIAIHLSLSEKTVRNYMQGVFSTLGCRDRTEAAILGIRRGLVPMESMDLLLQERVERRPVSVVQR